MVHILPKLSKIVQYRPIWSIIMHRLSKLVLHNQVPWSSFNGFFFRICATIRTDKVRDSVPPVGGIFKVPYSHLLLLFFHQFSNPYFLILNSFFIWVKCSMNLFFNQLIVLYFCILPFAYFQSYIPQSFHPQFFQSCIFFLQFFLLPL